MDKFKTNLGLGTDYMMAMVLGQRWTNLEFLPYDQASKVGTISSSIRKAFPISQPEDYALHLYPNGQCLDDNLTFAHYKLQGPLICQFKMKVWTLPVRFRISRTQCKVHRITSILYPPNNLPNNATFKGIKCGTGSK